MTRPPVKSEDPDIPAIDTRARQRAEERVALSRTILHSAARDLPRVEFLRQVSQALFNHAGCDAIEVRLNDRDLHFRWEAAERPEKLARFTLARWMTDDAGRVIPAYREATDLERVCRDVACQRFNPDVPCFTRNGSFWTGDTWAPIAPCSTQVGRPPGQNLCIGGHYRSLAVLRLFVDAQTTGLVHVKCERPNAFTEQDVEFYEEIAQTLGLAVADWRAEGALRERVKELTCLYGIAQVAERLATPLGEVLQDIVELLPPAWQYPDIAAARIVLDGRVFATSGFQHGQYRQSAEVDVEGRRRGVVEVVYTEEKPEFAVSAFLKEEEKLINAVAREVGAIVRRREAGEERSRLQQQLIHADRLATIGQLAAGVAHELNEPLSSILGFAQLAQKCAGLPEQAGHDIGKILTASLYAREVIKKLMVFARQVPPQKAKVSFNGVVEEAFFFLESRCAKGGIEVVRDLAPNLPEMIADASQLKQVLVNLVVNAIQAMPEGGRLTVTTRARDSLVSLVVEDTGIGMNRETLDKIFLPFFTTKEVSEGTGLGLSVVHGIVNAHGGSVTVESRPGQGTRFEICLPTDGSEEGEETAQNGNCR